MLARGIILLSGGVEQNVLSFTPPFVISEKEIDFAIAQLGNYLDRRNMKNMRVLKSSLPVPHVAPV